MGAPEGRWNSKEGLEEGCEVFGGGRTDGDTDGISVGNPNIADGLEDGSAVGALDGPDEVPGCGEDD